MSEFTLAALWEIVEACLGIAVLLILLGDWITDRQARKAKP